MQLIREKTLFLFDMDGTIYHENTLIPGAYELLQEIRSQGKKYVFMTNNSSKSKSAYIDKLTLLGIEAEEKNIVSSVNATITFINKHKPKAALYLVGTESLKRELQLEGFKIADISYRGEEVDFVLVGFDTELSYQKLENACYHISKGRKFIATNMDLRCPVKNNRYIPDCGAICHLISDAVDVKPVYLGKPEKEMILSASESFNTPLDKILCIGDRLYTDIACGINAGVSTAVVFTGETKQEDIANTQFVPDYQFQSVAEIYDIIK